MLRVIILAIGLCGATALTASAADKGEAPKKRTPLTEEQKATVKELKDKYDKNKDGKLSKEEREGMSAEDQTKMEKIYPKAKKTEGKKK